MVHVGASIIAASTHPGKQRGGVVSRRVGALHLQQPRAVALLRLRKLRVHGANLSLRRALGAQRRLKLRRETLQRPVER
jgi:hypothetical protein